MGKGDVYNRFIQIFSNKSGPATPAREQEIQQVFESAGLDFLQLWNDARIAANIPAS